MPKDKLTDFSETASDNTDIAGVGIQGTNAISNIDNAARALPAILAKVDRGTDPVRDTWTFGDPADLTKRVRLDAGGVTAGQTRVLTVPDYNGTIATLAGTEAFTNKTLTTPAITDPVITGCVKEDVYTITDGAAFEIDPSNGAIQTVVLGASRTPAATNFQAGEWVLLRVDDGTAYTITWSTVGVVWIGGTAPTLATSGYTHILLWKVGSTVYGKHVGDSAS
jgi:hypothetical protein